MTITWDDAAGLLAVAAVFDQRKGDELDVKAWLQVGQMQGWTFAAAERVILEHYSAGSDRPRIDPARITDRIKAIRSRAAESFEAPRIPDEISGAEYPAWFRAQLAAHVDRALAGWALSGEEPRALPAAPAQTRSLPELIAAAPEHLRGEMTQAARKVGRPPRRDRDGAA